MNDGELTFNGLVKLNTERPSFWSEPLVSQVHEIYENGLIPWIRYNECLLPSLNSLKRKETLINHDGEIKTRKLYFICNNGSLLHL